MKNKFDQNQKQIRKRLLEIIHKSHSSHIGSCVSVIDLIDAIYFVKEKDEKFVLSNGHTATSLYVILEKNKLLENPNLEDLHIHPDRNSEKDIDVSTGSLGQGLPIAVGLALANKDENVYCLISDGECAEGSIWESLRIISDFQINNLKLIVSVNGWGAYDPISSKKLHKRLKGFDLKVININGHNTNQIIKNISKQYTKPTILFAQTSSEQFDFLKGLDAHYYSMKDEDFKLAIKQLNDRL
jgi:transketolase